VGWRLDKKVFPSGSIYGLTGKRPLVLECARRKGAPDLDGGRLYGGGAASCGKAIRAMGRW
jgi:hypothetical protein